MSNAMNPKKLNVLGITGDQLFIRCLRMEMPLLNLKRNGLINDFFVADSYETDIPDDASFNVLWLQRVHNIQLIRHLSNTVNNQFLYDLDDLLIAPRS
jgi:hypothetical protein